MNKELDRTWQTEENKNQTWINRLTVDPVKGKIAKRNCSLSKTIRVIDINMEILIIFLIYRNLTKIAQTGKFKQAKNRANALK